MTLHVTLTDPREVRLTRSGDGATVWIDGRALATGCRPAGGAVEVTVDGRSETVWVAVHRDTVYVHARGRAWTLEVTNPAEARLRTGGGADAALAPMPGVVIALRVAPGEQVSAGQVLAVIESMKLQTEIKAPRDGVVDRVLVGVGDGFAQGAALVHLVVEEGDESAAGEQS